MRFIVNLVIKAGLLVLINHFGFLQLKNDGQPVNGWNAFWVALVIALVFVIILWVVGMVWGAATLFTLGLAFLLLPFLGALVLWLITSVTPQYLVIEWFWPMFLTGLLMMFVGLPTVTVTRSNGYFRETRRY